MQKKKLLLQINSNPFIYLIPRSKSKIKLLHFDEQYQAHHTLYFSDIIMKKENKLLIILKKNILKFEHKKISVLGC